MRINKYLAQARGISRREADKLIELGVVTINGQPANLGSQIGDTDTVTVNNRDMSLQEYQYILLNKPAGYVSSRRRQGDTPTLYELLPNTYHHLKPVGRLDKDSSGLMLLTNDGDYAHSLMHPSFHKQKEYRVVLDKPLVKKDQTSIETGIELHDGISALQLSGAKDTWIVHMHEGRNRQIRRTFARLDYTVIKLHRTKLGKYSLDGLKLGDHKAIATPDK